MASATERPQWKQWRIDVDAGMAMKTTTINQRRGRWMARRQRNGDGDGRCDGDAKASEREMAARRKVEAT